ncbi:hypothetical protein GCM10022252_71980 [Streptosporangium oxazolinicum]|uniref:Uncharacterized protein n=1 Tax=Streptosporangium oxazolinicum TaxID=909287 RepID=A0ABP8BIR3_9ACTN
MIVDALWRPAPAGTAVIAESHPGPRDHEEAGDAAPYTGHDRPVRTSGRA